MARGQYIFAIAGGCACHTVPKGTSHVGAREFPIPMAKVYSANLTADKETGIGEWSQNDSAEFLLTGIKPDLDNVQGLMAEVIEAGYKDMKREDALAIADYLKSIPPIANKIK